jgi:hypothetical protein
MGVSSLAGDINDQKRGKPQIERWKRGFDH